MSDFSSNSDVIDSREIVERIEELESMVAECERCAGSGRAVVGELTGGTGSIHTPDLETEPCAECASDREEKAILDQLVDEVNYMGSDSAKDGVTLIRDSYFTEYAQELAEEIGAINPDATWPADCIDWEKAARELRMDYSSVEFDGVTYWVR